MPRTSLGLSTDEVAEIAEVEPQEDEEVAVIVLTSPVLRVSRVETLLLCGGG